MKKLIIGLVLTVFLMGAFTQVADAATWRYHENRTRGGIVTVHGTINCQPVGPPLFTGELEYCNNASGWVPPWCNDYRIINVWDPTEYTCGNIDTIKTKVSYYDSGYWRMYPFGDWINDNVADSIIIPSLGDSTGAIQFVYSVVDIAGWLVSPPALQDTYHVDNGTHPNLPGYLICTTVYYDSTVGPGDNPFVTTTPITGTLWRDGEITFFPGGEDIPTLTEWGLILLALLVLLAGTIAVIRRRRTVAAGEVK